MLTIEQQTTAYSIISWLHTAGATEAPALSAKTRAVITQWMDEVQHTIERGTHGRTTSGERIAGCAVADSARHQNHAQDDGQE